MTTPNTQGASWEEEFDDQFNHLEFNGRRIPVVLHGMKDFIRTLLSKEREEGERRERERILTELDKSGMGQLMDFYSSNRGSGHTYAAVKGIENVPNSVLLVAHEDQKQNTGLSREKQISVGGREIALNGRRFAVVPDHFALQTLWQKARKAITTLPADSTERV